MAHRDWVRGVSVNRTETEIVSGDAKSAIGIWSLPRLSVQTLFVLPQYPDIELNAIMGLDFDPSNPFLYYALQRSGHLSMGDIRAGSGIQWHTKVHVGRASSMRIGEMGGKLATSARGSEIKMWDVRMLHFPSSLSFYTQTYTQHVSEKQPLSFDFLHHEQYLVTGSDSLYAYIYDVLTGALASKVRLSPGMVVTGSPMDRDSLAFYALFNDGQTFGVVDTAGDPVLHEFESSEQIKAQYSKEAWELALSGNTDKLLKASRAAQPEVAINYDQMMAVIRASDLSICKSLLRDLTLQYENNIKASTPRLVHDLQEFYRRTNKEDGNRPGKRRNSGKTTGKVCSTSRVETERTTIAGKMKTFISHQ